MSQEIIRLENASVRFNLAAQKNRGLKEYLSTLRRRELLFQEFFALRHIDLSVMAGESWGFVGRNGSGKSTLLKLITGILQPYEGTVSVRGHVAPLLELGAGFDPLTEWLKDERKDALLRQPGTTLDQLLPDPGSYSPGARQQAEISIKYEGYLQKEESAIRQAGAMEEKLLPADTPYEQITGLRTEARQKLAAQCPGSLGQAGRIPGVSPADVAVLMIWLKKKEAEKTE